MARLVNTTPRRGRSVNASLVSGLNGLNGPFGIAVSGANLWVTSEGSGAIGEYNATTGATVNASLVSGLNGPFGIAVSGQNLWVANTGGSTIGEYNATTGAAVNDSLVSGLNSPLGIAVLGGDLWVTNSSSGTIGQYNATTGAAVTTPSITDGGGATLSSLTVILMNPLAGDVLTATAGSGITVTPYNPPTGALLLSGLASLADYETVLASVQYNNIDGGPGVASESISIVANNGISSSNTAVSMIAINAPPVVELNPSSTNYATSWTNSGAVAITPNASTTFVSGLDNPNAIAVAGDDLWVANYNSGTISEYNATTGAVINASLISGLNGPVAIVVSGGNLWVANYSGGVELPGEESGSIGEYNATTGAAVNAELVDDTGNLQGMAMSGGTLWVTGIDPNAIGENSGFIEDYDAASGDAIGNQPGPTGQMFEVPLLIAALNNPTSIAVSGGNLWVDEGGGFGEYNATTGAVLAGPSGLSGPGRTDAVAVSGGDLFLANTPLGGTGRISEFNATTGVLINAALVSGLDVNSFSYPASIAVAGVNLWVANDDGTIDEYNANTGAPAVSAISIADGESATLSSMTIAIENHHAGDMLTAAGGGGITVTPYNPTTGVLLLSGTASLADYQTVLDSVQYNNTNGGPDVASETINIVANDGISHSNPAQATIVFTLPEVIGAQVDGTGWSPNFLAELQTAGEGNGTGYAIPVGSAAQSRPCHGPTSIRSRLRLTKR